MKIKTTLNLDATLVRCLRVRAARLGRPDTEIYEETLRRGLSAIDELRDRAHTSEDEELTELVDSAVHGSRSALESHRKGESQALKRTE
jgi:plasmid stability protein